MKENKIIQFLIKHRSKVMISFLAVACLIMWGNRLFNKNRTHHKQDFIMASQIFERFSNGEPLSIESIEMTESVLKRHPELHPKYDPMLAAAFFAQQKSSKARSYAESTMNHVKGNLPPLYRSYAETSLLISEEKYEKAFKQAQQLNNQLKKQTDCDTLYVMNLIRIIFLANELQQETLKKEAWEELQAQPAYAFIKPLFQEGQLTLSEYLN